MKSSIVAFLLALVSAAGLQAQFVTIPDANFSTWLNTYYPTCISGNQLDTTCGGIIGANSVNVSSHGIADLTGIQYFDALRFLYAETNYLTTLPPLPATLLMMSVGSNQIASLPSFPAGLKNAYLSNNQLTSLPPLPPTLEGLEVGANVGLVLPAVLPTTLQRLDVQDCGMTSLPALPSSLQAIIAANNPIGTFPALPASMRELVISDCGLSTLPVMPPEVRYLHIDNNNLGVLPAVLPDSLWYFSCDNTGISALPALPSVLTNFICDNNSLTTLPALPSTLTLLRCEHNQITSLPALPAGLQHLYATYNALTQVSNLPAGLNTADLRWNQITCFGPFPLSTTLNVSFANNPVTCIPNYAAFMTPAIGSVPICTPGNANGCVTGEGVGGTIFDDTNADCLLNGLDPGIQRVPVNVYDNLGTFIQGGNSHPSGAYFYTQPLGNWTVKIDTAAKPYRVTCTQPGLDSTVALSLGNELALGVDFEVDCKPGFDVGARGVGIDNILFPGQPFGAHVLAGDLTQFYGLHCSAGVSGQVIVHVSGPVTYTGALPGTLAPTVVGNTFTYTIADFGLVNVLSDLGLGFRTDTTAQAGDTVCFDVTVTPGAGDLFPANNTFSACYLNSNSLDPNAKDVYPREVGAGYSDWLTYTVHFQNTGTAPAFNIHVEDTLDADLDYASMEMLSASHYQTWTLMGNALDVHFPNIMLPDSASNPTGSQGWFMYRIRPKQNLPIGTVIPNSAAIYFDFNAPVITNTATTTYNLTTAAPDEANAMALVSFYPNPSAGLFNVAFPANWKKADWAVTNLLGQELMHGTASGGAFAVDIAAQPAGFYLLRVGNGNAQVVRQIVKR